MTGGGPAAYKCCGNKRLFSAKSLTLIVALMIINLRGWMLVPDGLEGLPAAYMLLRCGTILESIPINRSVFKDLS